MDRYARINAAHIVDGYYKPPSVSDHEKKTVEEKFNGAKNIALYHLEQRKKDVEALTLEDFLAGRMGK